MTGWWVGGPVTVVYQDGSEYVFSYPSTDIAFRYFYVDSDDTLRRSIGSWAMDIDYESIKEFRFDFSSGYAINQRMTTQWVGRGTIHVRDKNEPPRISGGLLVGGLSAGVSRFSPAGTVLGDLDSQDPDLPASAWGLPSHRWSIDGDAAGVEIDPVTGKLRTTAALADVRGDTLEFTVRVTDGGGLSAAVTITVTLTNRPPSFGGGYSFQLSSEPSAVIGRVAAFDPDTLLGDRLSYEIVSGGADLFTIDSSTGDIRTAGSSIPPGTYALTVRATDRGGLYAETRVTASGTATLTAVAGYGREGGTLGFDATIDHASAISVDGGLLEIDVDADGVYDISGTYDPELDGVLITDADLLHKLGSRPKEGLYRARARFSLGSWSTVAGFDIEIGNATPEITIAESGPPVAFVPYTLTITAADPGPDAIESITIDWGDGATETIPGNGSWSLTRSFTHTYQEAGDYVVVISASDGEDTAYETLTITVDGDAIPKLSSAYVTMAESGWVTVSVEATDHFDVPITDPSAFVWYVDGIAVAAGPTLAMPPSVAYRAIVEVTDAEGRKARAAYGFMGAGPQTFEVTPYFLGVAQPQTRPPVQRFTNGVADLDQNAQRDSLFELLYGSTGQILLEAFKRAGGRIEVVDLWWGSSDLDSVDGKAVIQLDVALKPVEAAQELAYQLTQAASSWLFDYGPAIRHELELMLMAGIADIGVGGTSDAEVGQLRQVQIDTLKAALNDLRGTTAEIAKLQAQGIGIFSVGADVVITVADVAADATKAIRERDLYAALSASMAAVPLLGVWVKKYGGKVVLRATTGKLIRLTGEEAELAPLVAKYADLVNENKWYQTTWREAFGEVDEVSRRKIRDIARKYEFIPKVAYDAKGFPVFDDFAYALKPVNPNVTVKAGNKVRLPNSGDQMLWKAGDAEQVKWLEDNVLGGPTPEGYIWHHHHDSGYMQLVNASIHTAYYHAGGRAKGMWGYPRTR